MHSLDNNIVLILEMELFQHPHIYNDVYERERLKVIEERLRQLHDQVNINQVTFVESTYAPFKLGLLQGGYLDDRTVKCLIRQCEQEQQIGGVHLQE